VSERKETMDPFDADIRILYDRLLRLAKKEEQALTADNLEELEACMCRKEELIRNLHHLENEGSHRGSSGYSEKVGSLLEQIVIRQERVRGGIKKMLDECQEAILEIRSGQRAHRAYTRGPKKNREHSARLL
jgi:hypothetical protein